MHGTAPVERRLEAMWNQWMGPLDTLLDRRLELPHGAPLTFAPAGELLALPLHGARRRNGADRRYFLEDWEVAYARSLAA